MAGDNPMQAEFASSIGLRGNKPCRCCHYGGMEAFKTSEEGFPTILEVSYYNMSVTRDGVCDLCFQPGESKNVQAVREIVTRQLELACMPGGEAQVKALNMQTGIKDSLATSVIEQVLQLGKELRRKQTGRRPMQEDDVQKVLHSIVENSLDKGGINPLLSMPGTSWMSTALSLGLSLAFQVSIPPRTLQLRYFTPFCSAS